MKHLISMALALTLSMVAPAAVAQGALMPSGGHRHQPGVIDTRIKLDIPEDMKRHQLANMREHVQAVQTIIGLIAEGNFENASRVAYTKLGLTPEMQAMCGSFNNEKFEELGLAFHRSGDNLGETLKTGNVSDSLRALSQTMQFCVSCHATFRQ